MTDLCHRYGVSRRTGYKWRDRYREGGLEALADRSRAPASCPHRTPEPLEEALVELRETHPRWGAKKLRARLRKTNPRLVERYGMPACSTVTELLRRHGLITPRPKRRKPTRPGRVLTDASAPGQIWSADFKGEFLIGTGRYCYPLTVCDHYSRYILGIDALASTGHQTAKPVFERLFHAHGVPEAIRTDNGAPFASRALCGLSRLSVYFTKLGIRLERIDPGAPQQNGRHERMHRTLKRDAARPPEATMAAQQRRFDAFREEFNHIRPHESLDQETPASGHRDPPRRCPAPVPEPEYAGHMVVRRISRAGLFRLRGRQPFLSEVLTGEYVAFEEVDDGIWDILFYALHLGRYDERTGRIYT